MLKKIRSRNHLLSFFFCLTIILFFAGTSIGSQYCDSRGNNASWEWIQSITVGDYSKASGKNNGYGDFSSETINLSPGSVPVTLTPGFSSSTYYEYWKIWIDFNHDLVFSADEAVFSSGSSGSISSSFTVPADAPSGSTGMRISMKYGGTPPACGNFTYGEVEDYTVYIENTTPPQPEIVSVSPEQGALNVSVSINVFAAFNTSMDGATINNSSFYVSDGASNVVGSVSYDDTTKTAQFTPNNDFDYLTTYTVYLTSDITDSSGTPFSSGHSWSFTTMENPNIPPQVTDIYPEINDTNIQVTKSIMVVFDKEMDETTINNTAFVISDGMTNVEGSISAGFYKKRFHFIPSQNLDYVTEYTVTLSTDITDSLGNAMANPYSWSFTTQEEYISAYCYSASNASNGEWIAGVEVNGVLNESNGNKYQDFRGTVFTLNTDSTPYSLTMGGGGIQPYEYWHVWIDWNQDGDYDDDNETVLSRTTNQSYPTASGNITIPPTALSGTTGMRVSMKWSSYSTPCENFPFGEVEDYTVSVPVIPPQIMDISPENGAQDVVRSSAITVTFSKAMNGTTINNSTFFLKQGTADISGTVSFDALTKTATFVPDAALSYETNYTVTLTTGIQDMDGLYLQTDFISSFTTEVEIPRPEVVSTYPGDNQQYIGTDSQISIDFSKDMDESTLTTANIIVSDGVNVNPVGGYFWYQASSKRAVFDHMEHFELDTTYYVTVTTGVLDTVGLSLAEEYSFSFKTTDVPGFSYCSQCSNDPNPAWISKVELGGVTNFSYKENCNDFYDVGFNLNSSSSTYLKVTASFSGTPTGQYFKVWIDWDKDGTFNDANEEILSSYGLTASKYIYIPANAVSGTTKMRIAMESFESPELCKQVGIGEVEDYNIVVP